MSQINNSSAQFQNPSRLRFDEEVGIHVVCQNVGMINSRGLWFHDDPLEYTLPLLLLQLSLISIITRSIDIFLKPLGQPSIVSHILGGVILGPSILGHNLAFMNKIFPREGRITLETLSVFGFMLFIFQIGVKIDPSIVWKSGKRALVVGILGFFIPFALASSIRLLLCHSISLDDTVCHVLQLVVLMQSVTAFPVIAIFLAEFKILNSDIGRLASSSSMICDICFWSFMSIIYVAHVAKEKSIQSAIGSILSVGFLVYLLLFGIRPAALWAIRNTPEGKPVKDAYIYVVFGALMGFGFLGEVIGINSLIASFLLGLVIPDGPPLGAAIVDRLDCFVSALLMPIFFTLCGLKTNVFSVQKWKTVGVIILVVFMGFLGKIIGTMLPPLFCRMPFRDALALGLLMNSKGIVELVLLNDWKTNSDSMTDECFAIMILSVLVLTAVISPLVKALYDPSRRFLAYRRRTICHHRSNEELRILACVLSQDNVRTIINLLDVSNHTNDKPIGIYVLHLIKLVGRASSLLIAHLPREKPSQNPTESERIFNAFKKFERENCSHVALHCCKSISPYESMHNDVCSVALENRISLIIIPFYKQSIDGKMVNSFHVFRHLNKSVLDNAPCSVGVLVDRGNLRKFLAEPLSCRIVVLFFGGADDREALAYAVRMSGNPHVSVTVLHFTMTSTSEGAEIAGGTARSKRLDSEILDEYKLNTEENERVSYLEEEVMDSGGVVAVIESIENAYDLVMVGKRHGESELMSSLGKWSEHIELGAVGEMLAVTDSNLRASVLVVQQQTRVWGLRDAEDSSLLRREKKDVAGVPNSNVYRNVDWDTMLDSEELKDANRNGTGQQDVRSSEKFQFACSIIVSTFCSENKNSKKYAQSPEHLISFSVVILHNFYAAFSNHSALTQYILTPLGESAFISMLLVGFFLGPSLWGDKHSFLSKVYSAKSINVSSTFAFFGCILYLFLLGIKMDLGMVKRAGRKAVVIGFFTFIFPITLNLIVAEILTTNMEMDQYLHDRVPYIAVFQSVTTFHVIVCLVTDLKLINSELGQLAISSSMISGTCSWSLAIFFLFIDRDETHDLIALILITAILLVMIIFFLLRPIMIWMTRKTSEGKQIKETYVTSIFIMLLGCAFLSEVFGHHVLFGAVTLGMAVPHGPPLGSDLVNKIESFVSSILLPSYFVFSVAGVNIFSIHLKTVTVVSIFGVSSFIGKVLGSMLPALYFKIPPSEAFSLGLVMSCQGVSDVLLIQHGRFLSVMTLFSSSPYSATEFYAYSAENNIFLLYLLQLLNTQIYSIMVINMLFLSGTFTPIIKLLYDPSKRYESCNKRTIQHTSLHMELRILACIYHQDSTPCIIRLLELTNPTAKTPMCCYAVHLVQLTGSLVPHLVHHEPGKSAKFHAKDSSHIINAFRLYEQECNGNVVVNLFTSISPFSTIHEEVCRLAAEKSTSLVIIPFHKQWRLHGIKNIVEARSVNRHILDMAPCSVGILVDRGTLSASKNNNLYEIGVLFAHGNDDREALAYGLRMAKHSKAALTVIHLIDLARTSQDYHEMELDSDIITEYKIESAGKRRHSYRQESVNDCVELIRLITSVENSFDLILVGRSYRSRSPLFEALTEWSEFPELGFMGDILTQLDSQCRVSVLVVQQQISGA
ncbi:hypothetical protein DKX38_029990 [Salix brachista]|uniref:Cation/H+ exchanger domain-containing protein n=1 Tax=Salix brachista TaxID=2182728 RepID=A0A5N5J202_9ROSI|nr:hypothetical protein DKX38_029990 [Salix brachista]